MRGIFFFLLLVPMLCSAQLKKTYQDVDLENEVRGISFYNANEGFVAFMRWIGYTTDGGKSFTRKYISYGNVNFNGAPNVNLTFGFAVNGVHAVDKNRLIVYGHYGFVPAILVSYDQGNSYKLVYHATVVLKLDNYGFQKVAFIPGSQTGYAVEQDRIIKTVNNGETWSVIRQDVNGAFSDVEFPSATTGYVIGSKMLKTQNSGANWSEVTKVPGQPSAMSFLNADKGWINVNSNLFYTSDGGANWQIRNKGHYHVGKPMKFINDSTGFSVGGFTVFKTTDSGKIWEPIVRDNSFEYLNYAHEYLFFLDPATFWVGGSGFLESSTASSTPTLPVAVFDIDGSELNSANRLKMVNGSKEGNLYKWYVNSALVSQSYNASYISSRLTIDTIRLVVIKGADSSVSEIIFDTRSNPQPCTGAFTTKIDTNSVKFNPAFTVSGVTHYWDFGDGTIDSLTQAPVHTYAKVGTYNLIHRVYNPIDRCNQTSTATITIERTQNCFKIGFSMTADSFYTNRLAYAAIVDPTTELREQFFTTYAWDFGNGKGSNRNTGTAVFDSARTYNVCLSVTNASTGCVSKVCKNIDIYMDTVCNAKFNLQTSGKTVILTGKPPAERKGKQNTWTFTTGSNTPVTVNTGNSENLNHSFFEYSYYGGSYFSHLGSDNCDHIYEICIDSLNKKIRHAVYDSTTGCSDSTEVDYLVPRQNTVFIRAVPNPIFKQIVTFYSYTILPNGKEWPYYGRWRIENYYAGGYTGPGVTDYLTYTFRYSNRFKISIGANSCNGSSREIYYIYQDVQAEACPVYPPDFTYQISTTNKNEVAFKYKPDLANSELNNTIKWYFGDGDSSTQLQPKHVYANPGSYKATMRYTNKNGCYKEETKTILVGLKCTINAAFTLNRDAISKALINFTNRSTTDTGTLSYKWYFGTGDSSSQANPSYTYSKAGTYKITLKATAIAGCENSHDTSIVITEQDIKPVVPIICSVKAAFNVSGTMKVQSPIKFTNLSSSATGNLTHKWYFGNGDSSALASPEYAYKSAGTYKVTLRSIEKPGCESVRDTTLVITTVPACDIQPLFTVDVQDNTVHFFSFNQPVNPNYKLLWNFGDGYTDSLISVKHQYKGDGDYNVCLKVTRDANCSVEFCDTVSIRMNKPVSLDILPNPVGPTIQIRFNSSESGSATISIYNYQGRLVKQSPYHAVRGTNQVTMDISDLNSGFYTLRISGLLENFVKKFIKI